MTRRADCDRRSHLMHHNNNCLECHGSGQCQACHGTGVNLHLNEPVPHCRTCGGSGRCATCGGDGLRKVVPARPHDLPLGLRVALSAIPCVILWAVFIAQAPVHLGRGGPILPKPVGWAVIAGLFGSSLYTIWKGVSREDLCFWKNSGIPSLFGSSPPPGTSSSDDDPDSH